MSKNSFYNKHHNLKLALCHNILNQYDQFRLFLHIYNLQEYQHMKNNK